MKRTKRIGAVLAACVLAGSCIPQTAFADVHDSADVFSGDVDQSGSVDVSDAVLLARYCLADPEAIISEKGLLCADVNCDGYIDTDDILDILQYIAGLRESLGASEVLTESQYSAVNLMEGTEAGTVQGKPADDAFLHSQLALTAELLRSVSQRAPYGNNLLISPLSISQALAMTANGAKGETKSEMEAVLGGGIPMESLNEYYYDYTSNLADSKYGSAKLANSLWYRDRADLIQVPDAFLQINADYYGAGAFRAPFDQTTVEDINNWVSYHTNEMIPSILNEINDSSVMYLVNALAFEAEWGNPYETNQIGEGKFTRTDGTQITVPMMYGSEYTYLEDEYATGFIKDYKDGAYSFAAILPKASKAVTVSDYIGMMTAESLQTLLNSRSSEKVFTQMPKFSFSYGTSLKTPLKEMGMPTAFSDDTADFTGLNALGSTYIGDVLHSTFITVDARGTKAGAVTVVDMAAGDSAVTPKEVYLDRPFIFMILDERTSLPIFIGYVMDPSVK